VRSTNAINTHNPKAAGAAPTDVAPAIIDIANAPEANAFNDDAVSAVLRASDAFADV